MAPQGGGAAAGEAICTVFGFNAASYHLPSQAVHVWRRVVRLATGRSRKEGESAKTFTRLVYRMVEASFQAGGGAARDYEGWTALSCCALFRRLASG